MEDACILDHEGVAHCCRKCKPCKWWSWTFMLDYVAVVFLFIATIVVKFCWEPYEMYVPTTEITTAVVDSQGNTQNVQQQIQIDEHVMFPAVKESLPTAVLFVVIFVCALVVFGFAQLLILPFRLCTPHSPPHQQPHSKHNNNTHAVLIPLKQSGTGGTS